jgi:hypothetical protein
MKQKSKKKIFKHNQIGPGIALKNAMSKGGNQPPRKRIEANAEIKIILAYSPRKNIEKGIELYSTL